MPQHGEVPLGGIGQQARVRVLYFIGRGTLDEVLWKLIEKKYRDLGEFMEGKENMDFALERVLEDGEEEEILRQGEDEGDDDGDGPRKRKRKGGEQDAFGELFDADALEITKEIEEMCHVEEDMLNVHKTHEEEEEPETDIVVVDEGRGGAAAAAPDGRKAAKPTTGGPPPRRPPGPSSETVIELLDDEDPDVDRAGGGPRTTVADIRELYRASGVLAKLRIDPHVQFNNLRLFTLRSSLLPIRSGLLAMLMPSEFSSALLSTSVWGAISSTLGVFWREA